MGIPYPVELTLKLQPVINVTAPRVIVATPHSVDILDLDTPKQLQLKFVAVGSAWLQIDFVNKNYAESNHGHDMAVIVESVSFFGIQDPKFVWAAQYRPIYPEPWFSEQIAKPNEVVQPATYLGWNGSWRLDFDVPVFGWMHQVLNLGWCYD